MSAEQPLAPAAGPGEPLVSVLMVLWNCAPELPACFASLAREAERVPLEVICVDNGSADASAAVARQHDALILEMGMNAGFPVAVNAALAKASAPYVLLLNPDVELGDGCLSRCLDELTADPTVGLVGCNLRRTDGAPDWAAARRFRSLSAVALETFGLTRLSLSLDLQYMPRWSRTTSRDVDCVNGAFMLLSTELLRDLGGLDESVFMYLEDQELCRQLWARGLRVRFVADAPALHIGGASTLRADPHRKTLAYLHRTDADIELIARRRGGAARLAAVALFGLRALFGYGVGAFTGRPDLRWKYRTALRWLSRQLVHRQPPPPIP